MDKANYSVLLCVLFITIASGFEIRWKQCPEPQPFSETFTKTLTMPEGCIRKNCDYFLGLRQDERDPNLLQFVLEGYASGWVAIGFSLTPSMESADVLGCRISTDGIVEAIDTWNSNNAKVNVLQEAQNDLCYYSAEYKNGRLQCIFSRDIRGSSDEYDLDFNNYYHFIYGTGNTYTPAKGGLSYHETTPLITIDRINPVNGLVKPEINAKIESDRCSSSMENTNTYRLTQRMPQGCIESECDYFMGISDNGNDTDVLDITLQAKAKGWVAVGFSKTADMFNSDVLGCVAYSNGGLTVIDTWNPSPTMTNILDSDQSDTCQQEVEIKDGMLKCKLSRSIKGGSKTQDLILNDNYYFLFGAGDTPQESSSNGLTFHEQTPKISKIRMNPARDSDLTVKIARELHLRD